ncbi:hypothetical protein M9458_046795, partial [Cirrhinus mrigala]
VSSLGQVVEQKLVLLSEHLCPQRQQAVLAHEGGSQVGHRAPSLLGHGLVALPGQKPAVPRCGLLLLYQEVHALAAAVGNVG